MRVGGAAHAACVQLCAGQRSRAKMCQAVRVTKHIPAVYDSRNHSQGSSSTHRCLGTHAHIYTYLSAPPSALCDSDGRTTISDQRLPHTDSTSAASDVVEPAGTPAAMAPPPPPASASVLGATTPGGYDSRCVDSGFTGMPWDPGGGCRA